MAKEKKKWEKKSFKKKKEKDKALQKDQYGVSAEKDGKKYVFEGYSGTDAKFDAWADEQLKTPNDHELANLYSLIRRYFPESAEDVIAAIEKVVDT